MARGATLPDALPGTRLRILGTSDLGAATVPVRTSHGHSGTCAGVVELLERERERQPTIWLDLGDLVVGNPSYALLGERPWAEVRDLPIDAAAVGNHEFDDGLDALLESARTLSFPLLCANVDIGLPQTAVVDTGAGDVGVIGLTHPRCDRLSEAPPIADDWTERVRALAGDLRADGARWVVALLHDGVEWWPDDGAVATRTDRLDALAQPWAADVDLILAGHNFAAWSGRLGGTPAAEPHLFASSLVVVDLADDVVVRGISDVPGTRPTRSSPAIAAVDAAAANVVGETAEQWLTRTGAPHYLPDLIADGLRRATGADAGFAMPGFHGIQAPLDGAIAALGPGSVTELDVVRMCASPDYAPVVAELRPGELRAAAAAQWSTADPRNTAGDELPWNWCRMPAGVSAAVEAPATVAVIPGVLPHLRAWLDRDVEAEPTGCSPAEPLLRALNG